MPTTAAKRDAFRALHREGCFVMPNPWDRGSARYLESLGFRAVATTSAGFAWTRGVADNAVPLDEALAHFTDVAAGIGVPLNADFEGGFADAPEQVAANVARAAATGIAGVSIEDSTGRADAPLYEFAHAVERVHAAAAALAATGVVLTARTEGFLVGRSDLDESVRRLAAFAEAGAECLYAPGIRTPGQVTAIVRGVAPRAVNVLVGGNHTTVAELAALGVRRISVGGALARTAWAGAIAAAREIAESGTFDALARGVPFAELNGRFAGR